MKKRYNLFLDDERFPYIEKGRYDIDEKTFTYLSAYAYSSYEPFRTEKWVIVRSYDAFVKHIKENGLPELIAFDHDLADVHYIVDENDIDKKIEYDNFEEKTGFHAAKWLCEYCQDNELLFPRYVIHSWNTQGRINIESYVENYIKHVEN